MAFANDPTDPANMTPEERLAEVAAIFAEGVLCLRRRAAIPGLELTVIHYVEYVESVESAGNRLEVPSETRLDGQGGYSHDDAPDVENYARRDPRVVAAPVGGGNRLSMPGADHLLSSISARRD